MAGTVFRMAYRKAFTVVEAFAMVTDDSHADSDIDIVVFPPEPHALMMKTLMIET